MVEVLTPRQTAEFRADAGVNLPCDDAHRTSARMLVAYRNHLLAELRYVERELELLMREPAD